VSRGSIDFHSPDISVDNNQIHRPHHHNKSDARQLLNIFGRSVGFLLKLPFENGFKNREILRIIILDRWTISLMALYLCFDDAGFITGNDIVVDGGWTAQ